MFAQMTFDDLFKVENKSCLTCEYEPEWVQAGQSVWGLCKSCGPTFISSKYDPDNQPVINKINAKYGKDCESWRVKNDLP